MMGKRESAEAQAHLATDEIHWSAMLGDLAAGKLDRLAAYIRQEDGHIDRAVALRLALMLDGKSDETEFCLTLKRHPELKRAAKGPYARIQATRSDRKIGNFIAKYIIEHGCKREAAFAAAIEQFDLSRATILAIWTRTRETSMMRENALAALRKG
jgi:hypothetical protein